MPWSGVFMVVSFCLMIDCNWSWNVKQQNPLVCSSWVHSSNRNIIPKNEKELCVKLFEVTNTTWENLHITTHKSVSTSYIVLICACNLRIFSGFVCHLEQLHAQSPFLFPIVFGVTFASVFTGPPGPNPAVTIINKGWAPRLVRG